MRDVLEELLTWWEAGEEVALGTVVGTWQSAPRQPGAAMLVGVDGEAVGSVSGGCVEGAVYELGQEVIGSGSAPSGEKPAAASAPGLYPARPSSRRHDTETSVPSSRHPQRGSG